MHDFYPLTLINQGFSVSTKKMENLNGRMRLARGRGGFPLLLVIRYIEVNLYFVPKEIHRIFDRKKATGAYIL